MLPGTFWLRVVWSPPGWRRLKMLVEAASDRDLSQQLPVNREPTKVPREWHGRNPGHSWPGGCQRSSLGTSADLGYRRWGLARPERGSGSGDRWAWRDGPHRQGHTPLALSLIHI